LKILFTGRKDLKGGAGTAASQGSENFSPEKYRRPSPLLGTFGTMPQKWRDSKYIGRWT